MTMTSLQNKTALVTGASRGIGRATALALARAGAHVLVHYGHSAQEAASVVAAIQAENGRANAVSADLGTPDGAALLAKQVRSIVGDRLDVLVLNAGISKSARIADYTVEDFDNLFATNVRGPFFLVQQLAGLCFEDPLGGRFTVDKLYILLGKVEIPCFKPCIQPRSTLNMTSITRFVAPPLRILPCCIWKRESEDCLDLFERGGNNGHSPSRFET